MKCIVLDCENHSHQGLFAGALCMPCYIYISSGDGKYSQAYRNAMNTKAECIALLVEEVGRQTAIRIRGMK